MKNIYDQRIGILGLERNDLIMMCPDKKIGTQKLIRLLLFLLAKYLLNEDQVLKQIRL
jgi:hypothetical protein